MLRRVLQISGALLAVLLLAAATLPWWFGMALGWAGGRWLGVEFADYERLPEGRVALTGLVLVRPEVTVRLDRIEADGPWSWIGFLVTGGQVGDVQAGGWLVTVPERTGERDAASPGDESGWMPLQTRIGATVDALRDRVPPLSLGAGVVVAGGREFHVGPADWVDGRLQVESLTVEGVDVRDIELRREGGEWRLLASGAEALWTLQASTDDHRVTAAGDWRAQPWTAAATFAPTGWRPEAAELVAQDWRLDESVLRVAGPYREVTGGGRARWVDGRAEFTAEFAGEPVREDVPALNVTLAGTGDWEALSLDALTVRATGLEAVLDEPVKISPRTGELLSETSRFTLKAELEKWPSLASRGQVTGRATVKPDDNGLPAVEASFAAEDIESHGWRLQAVEGRASLRWPRLVLSDFSVDLPNGEKLALSGEWDLREQVLKDGRVTGSLSSQTLAPWMPHETAFKLAEFSVQAEGVWPELRHTGEMTLAEVRLPAIKPFDAKIEWTGLGQRVENTDARLDTGKSVLTLSAGGDLRGIRVTALQLIEGDRVQWDLSSPVAVTMQPDWRIEPLVLEGEAGRLRLAGGSDGLEFSASDVPVAWLRPWLLRDGPDWVAEQVDGRFALSGAFFSAELAGRARMTLNDRHQAVAELKAAVGEAGIRLDRLAVTADGQALLTAGGHIPLMLRPSDGWRAEWLPDGELDLKASSVPDARFWQVLAEFSGLIIESPAIDVAISGTPQKPVGRASVAVARIATDPSRWSRPLPELTDLRAELRGDAGGITLEPFSVRLAGQSISASGRLPVPPVEWGRLFTEPARLAGTGGTLRIQIADAEVAALARFLPEVLAPTGRLYLDVALREDGGWDGQMKLRDAATRPLGPLGVLADINADLTLRDRSLELGRLVARIGGQPAELEGRVDFSNWQSPAPDLRLHGENLPLLRRSGILVRTDIDLRAQTGADGRVTVKGTTTLRDSLLLADLRSLLPKGGQRGPARRPPYFSVELAPVNRWALDVVLQGDRFMRVRTPLFNGRLSAKFRLGGTLGEPTLLGEATVNQGTIRLPFASFAVDQGAVRVGQPDPTTPRINLRATGRSYGYDLRMELSGTTDSPELTFTSTPPLTSEQVLLMVMAGETPENEISYTAGQRAVRVGTYLGQSLLDTFGFAPAGADRLTVNVGERISEQGRETYDVEYELTPKWSLTGEYSEFDDYNVGVKWRFYPSKPTPEEPAGPEDEQP